MVRFFSLLLLCSFIVPHLAASASDVEEEAGRRLFVTGKGADGPVMASVGAGQVEVPAASMPCASCHGRDGRGRPEGAVVPPDITGPRLAGLYDGAKLIRAMTLGVAATGRPLDPVMPRYRLTLADAEPLARYVLALGTRPEPGLESDRLVVGALLPRADAPAGALLRALADRLDAGGGVFGRRIEIVVASPDPPGASPAETARRLLAERGVFALVAPMIARDEAEMAALADVEGLPLVGAETLMPEAAGHAPHYLFFLDGGVAAEADALARVMARRDHAPVVVVEESDPLARSAADAAAAVLAREGIAVSRRVLGAEDTPAGLGAELAGRNASRLLWLAADLDAFAGVAQARNYHPALFVPAEFSRGLTERSSPLPLTLAFRSGPRDLTPEALEDYRALAEAASLPETERQSQLRALVAMRLFISALKQAGRDVTREKLVTTLEAMRDFRSGLMPVLGFSPSRHSGTAGAWVLSDGQPAEWIGSGQDR